jgi:ribonuclease-3 family protein
VTSEEEESSNSLDAESALHWAEVRFRQLSAVTDSNLRIQQISSASLAYLGDAVYELYIRTHHLLPPKRISDYHHQVVAQVRAESQASHLRSLEPYLTDPELEILRRGRNAVTGSPRRLEPKTYQQATSLETLMGYLYLTNPQRLTQLLAHLDLDPH